jgi:hypothetical protein
MLFCVFFRRMLVVLCRVQVVAVRYLRMMGGLFMIIRLVVLAASR